MEIQEILSIGSILMLLSTAVLHSAAGEKYLIRPLLKHRGNRVLDHSLARMVIRFAWHLTSAMWVLLAFIIYVVVFTDGATTHLTLLSIGWCFLVIGIFDLVASRGRHVGWPFLTLTGVFALAAAYFY